MARDVTFMLPCDVPTTPMSKRHFKLRMLAIREQQFPLTPLGEQYEPVGIGFVWETTTGMSPSLYAVSKWMRRLLTSSGILSENAEFYFLEQRLTYVRSEEPNVVFHLKED